MKIEFKNLQLVKVIDSREGQGKKGFWKQENLLLKQTYGENESLMSATLFGVDKIEQFHKDCDGAFFDATLFIDAREWQGRYYNEISLWQWNAQARPQATIQEVKNVLPKEEEQDLPF